MRNGWLRKPDALLDVPSTQTGSRRGPFVPGRIVDLSPDTAREIGISHRKGVALVVVAPIAVPQPDGGVKLGAAAHEALGTTTVTKAIRDASIDTRTVQR